MAMAGRKFRIGRHRKNREKKAIVEDQPLDELKVSLPLTAYVDAAVGPVALIINTIYYIIIIKKYYSYHQHF